MEEILSFIENSKRIFAKTYAATAPHEYVVKGMLMFEKQKVFEKFVMFIRQNGYEQEFGGVKYTYYDIGKYKYWTMGNPIHITTTLNRALK